MDICMQYRVELEKGLPMEGEQLLLLGENHVIIDTESDLIVSAEVVLPVEWADTDRVFFNGYQTWTGCPEYKKEEYVKDISRLPDPLIQAFGLHKYGDSFFVNYDERPGHYHGFSYCYFRTGKTYRLFASLDEEPGYTIFTYDAGAETMRILRDCAGIRTEGEYHVLDLFYAEGTEDEVFDAWFAAMDISPRTTKQMTGYSSWYNRYTKITDQTITEDLEGCAKVLRPGDLFQIDDGWECQVGDWQPDPVKFPRGMKASVDDIHEKGFLAGLWVAPFVANKKSRIYKEHPDWFYKVGNKPWYKGSNWGGFFSLDIDHPEVEAYLEECFRQIFEDWGFDLVKLDFLYAAAPYGSEDETRAGRMIRAMKLLRKWCGDKLILGCGVPVMPAFGLVDYCRISCDVSLDWNNNFVMQHTNRERVSTRNAILNSIYRRQLNGRAYISDPDVFFLRENNIKLNAEQKYVLATVNALFGGLLLTSDNMGEYDEKKRRAYAQILAIANEASHVHVETTDTAVLVQYALRGKRYKIRIPL